MDIGKNIFELRKANNLTQSTLAEKLGVSEQSVSKWENGVCAPDVSLFPVMANLFGVSIDRLFGYQLDSYDKEVEKIEAGINELGDSYKEIVYLENALKKYPNSAKLKIHLSFAYSMIYRIGKTEEERNSGAEKAIALCDEVIGSTFDQKLLDSAYNMQVRVFSETGDFDRALAALERISAKTYSSIITGKSQLLCESKKYGALARHVEQSLWDCFYAMVISLRIYSNSLHGQKKFDDALKLCCFRDKFLSLFDDGGEGFFAGEKMFNSLDKAHFYKKFDQKQKCLEELKRFVNFTVQSVKTLKENHSISKRNNFFTHASGAEEYLNNPQDFAQNTLSSFSKYFGDDPEFTALLSDLLKV